MPRKSRQLRLEQSIKLLSLYDAENIENRSHTFIRDMVLRLTSRDISSGQKQYLDSLIEQGVPEVKNENPKKVAIFKAILELDGMQHRGDVIKSFIRSLRNGWQLSEKQKNFIKIILNEAEDIRENGIFCPTGEIIADLQVACQVASTKNGWYWTHRQGTYSAWSQVGEWLEWNSRVEVFRRHVEYRVKSEDNLENALKDEPKIDRWACDKLLKAFKTPINELKNPKHLIGEFRWTRAGKTALIMDIPALNDSKVVYACLVDGGECVIESSDLLKRKS